MKKLLSFVLVAVMLFSAMSVFSSAAADYGTLVFEENFDDATKAATYLAAAVGRSLIRLFNDIEKTTNK